MKTPVHKSLLSLREFGLSLPAAREDFPFGHSVLKVNKKIFLFLGSPEQGDATIAVKLSDSCEEALERKCAKPTGYGLGRGEWVTVTLGKSDTPSTGTLREWIEESYRAVAPKKLAAGLEHRQKKPRMAAHRK